MLMSCWKRQNRVLLIAASSALSIALVHAPAHAEKAFACDSGTDSLYTFDVITGVGVIIGPLHPDPARYTTPISMAERPSDGEIFVVNNSPASDAGLSTVDRTTGLATHIGGPGGTICFDGNLRLLTISGGALATLSQTTGLVISTVGAGLPTPRGMDFDPNTGELYAISGPSSGADISRIDPCTGALLSTVALSMALSGSVPGALVVDSSGTVHGCTNGAANNLFEVDPVTGVVSNLRTSAFRPQGLGRIPLSLCPSDLDRNRDVGFSDLLQVLGDWGPCP